MNNGTSVLTSAPAAPAAPVTPATGTGATPPATPAAAPSAANGEWYGSIADEGIRTWAQAKGWKDPIAAVESNYNLEKLIGFEKAGRTLVVPKDDATPEEMRAFQTKLGVPEKPDGYKLPIPDGQGDEFAKTASGWFHEAGIPAKSAEKLAAKWNEYAASQQQAMAQKAAQQGELDMQGLKTEWGAAFDKQIELARRATMQFIPAGNNSERAEVLSKIESAIGTGSMMKLFARIGEGLGEHAVHQGDAGGFGVVTPAQAKHQIEVLKSDKTWTSAYLSGDKVKIEEMTRLTKLAFPETA